MKRLPLLLLMISYLLVTAALSQSVKIKPASIRKKENFKTIVSLTNDEKYKGKLSSVTDTSLIIILNKTSRKKLATTYDFMELSYDQIEWVKLKHVSPWITFWSTFAGFFGSAVLMGTWAVGGTIHEDIPTARTIAFSVIGVSTASAITISQVARKKYKFPVNGDADKFSFHFESMKKMAINQDQ